MRPAACSFSRLRGFVAGLALVWALQPAGAALAGATPLPPISPEQQAQLAQLTFDGKMDALRALMKTLEREHDTASMPTYGTYRAMLLFSEEKSQQGLQELSQSLSLVKQQWEESPTEEHGSNYAFVLDGQAELLQMQALNAEASASRDLAHAVALQALGPSHIETQWLLYKRMYLALSNARYPLALQLTKELQQTLPKPLSRCREDLCLSLRFQQANLAGSMGDAPLAMRLSKQLMPDLDGTPGYAAWNIYQLVNLSVQLKQPRELQRWCKQARAMATQPRYANLEGMNRVTARCLRAYSADTSQLDALLQQEIRSRGAGGDGSAYLLLQKAEHLSKHNHPEEAIHAAAQAWAIGVAKNVDYWQWQAQRTIAESMIDAQRMPEAIYHAKQAINVQQRMLNDKGLEPAQRDAALRMGGEIYEELAEWLLQAQRFTEAEQTLTLAREQSYHQLVRSYRPPQRMLELTPSEQQRSAATLPLQAALRRSWQEREHNANALLQTLAQTPQALDERLSQPEYMPAAPGSLKVLGVDQTEIRYLPAPEHVYVVIRRGNQPERHLRLPIAQNRLTQDIALLRRELQQRGSNPQGQAHSLYQQLWQPLVQWLPAPQPKAAAGQAPEVRIHLEGALRYLPMAALHDGKHWLGESYALPQDTGVQASASAVADTAAALQRDGWSLQGTSRAVADLPALPKVREEIDGLAHLAGSQGIDHDRQQDDAFTADSLRAALQTRKIVHLASHFRLLPGNGQASGLYLGNGKLLTLGELSDPSFRFDGLDLLTLSACETAVPSGPAEMGLPVDSLAWLAQARGTRHVLASLWAVADEGTQQFMAAFYAALSSPMDHAQALRAAQLAMLRSPNNAANHPSLRGLSVQPMRQASVPSLSGLTHPYYWSAFVLLTGAQ